MHSPYFLTFTEVTRFEINVETLLYVCANFFINWLWYKCSLGLRTVSRSVKSKADHSRLEETVSKRKKPSNWNFINKGLQMWAPDQWKVNKGKIVTRRSQSSNYRPMLRNTRQSWILDPIPWIVDSGCWIRVFFSGTWILDSIPKWNFGVLELYSGFQSPGFRIPRAKFSRILDSTSKNFPDSRIRIPLHGAKY